MCHNPQKNILELDHSKIKRALIQLILPTSSGATLDVWFLKGKLKE
jgi:hypothetical protein